MMLDKKASAAIYKAAVSNNISDMENGLIVYLDSEFYDKDQADKIYEELEADVEYDRNSKVVLFGKNIPIPRKQGGYGDPGTSYTFSGTTVRARPWIPILSKIKRDVEKTTGRKFNFCLVNRYKNGSEYIGYHKDDEADLGSEPWIASLSFGCERKFYFKSDDRTVDVVKTTLSHGSLCVMIHPTNSYWKHSVPKESIARCSRPRINLTFRMIDL